MLSFFALPIHASEEQTQRARIVHLVVCATVLFSIVVLILVMIQQPSTVSRAVVAAVFLSSLGVVLLYLNRRGRIRLAAILFAVGLITLMTAVAVTAGGIRSPGVTMYFIIVLITGLLLGERAAAITGVVCALLGFGLLIAGRSGLLPPAIQYTSTTIWLLSCLYMGIVIVLMRLPTMAVRNAVRYAQSELLERRRVEQELIENQKLLNTMIESTPAAVAMFDTQMRYIACSRRWLIDYRLGHIDVKGLSHYDVFPEISEEWKAVHARCLAGATEAGEEEHFPRTDGSEDIVRWIVQPWRYGSGEIGGIVIISEVITDRVRAREERRSLRSQLQQAQKIEALGTLAGGIAHDFNNLLAMISTNAELGRAEMPEGAQARDYFDEIKRATARANDVVRQILLFSRRQDAERETISLLPIVVDAMTLLRATLPANVEFRTALDQDTLGVLANASQVYQILINLGTNAGQAMPTGGVLSVGLDRIFVTEALALGDLHQGKYVRITVRDNGTGMSRATMDRVFEPFYTTKGLGGTGLGLSVVHGLVKDHGGAITIESELGKGSTFRVYFPVAHAGGAGPSHSTADTAVHGTGQHIMYIDDEEALARAIRRALMLLDYRCTVYSDPMIAVESFRANPGQFDAVIADMTMPRLSGLDVARELRAIRPDIPIALTSGISSQETERLMSSLGINAWLPKPATIEELSNILDVLLRKAR